DRDTFAARDLEADPAQRLDAFAATPQAGPPTVRAAELLAQVLDFYCGHVLLQTRFEGMRNRRACLCFRRRARNPYLTEAQHRAVRLPTAPPEHKACVRPRRRLQWTQVLAAEGERRGNEASGLSAVPGLFLLDREEDGMAE